MQLFYIIIHWKSSAQCEISIVQQIIFFKIFIKMMWYNLQLSAQNDITTVFLRAAMLSINQKKQKFEKWS